MNSRVPTASSSPQSEDVEPTVRIMFVDDEANILNLLSLQFEELGYRTLKVRNSREALAQYKQFNPHAVVLDYRMPYLTGLSVFEQLKEYDADCRGFLLTAWADEDVRARASTLGISGCFCKPINFPVLTKAVVGGRKR